MVKCNRNKAQINATVTPYIKRQCKILTETEDFSSISDVVTQALSEFILKYYERNEHYRKFKDIEGVEEEGFKNEI